MTARLLTTFTKIAEAGTISISGLKAGDLVLGVVSGSGVSVADEFAGFVVSDGELLQLGPDEDSPLPTCTLIVERAVMLS